MEVGKLTVNRRNKTGKGVARKLRAQGRLPGICYGTSIEPITVDLDGRAFRASLDPAKRQNTVIDLTIEDGGKQFKTISVMVKDYQIHPIRREITHVDFVAVDLTQDVTVEVPLVFTGKAKGLTEGGTLHVVRHELLIRCKPSAIPSQIEVDITEMDMGSVLHVSDLKLPEGVTAGVSAQLTIITMAAPASGAAATEGAAAAAPEGAAAAS